MKTATFHFSDKDVTIHYEPFGEPDYSVVMTDANEVSRHIFDLTDAGWNIRFTHPQKTSEMSKHNPIIEYNNGSTGEFFGHGKCTISQLIFLATDFAPYGATMFRILVGRSRSLWMHISR